MTGSTIKKINEIQNKTRKNKINTKYYTINSKEINIECKKHPKIFDTFEDKVEAEFKKKR